MKAIHSRRTSTLRLLSVFFILAFFGILNISGIKEFHTWPQVDLLWQNVGQLGEVAGNFHFYRFIVAYPGLALEENFIGNGFSLYISFFIALSALYFGKCYEMAVMRKPKAWAWIVFLCFFLPMNGRGAIGWTGWLMCIYSSFIFHNLNRTEATFATFLRIISGILLSSVSSGIFLSCIMLVGYFFSWRVLVNHRHHIKRHVSLKRLIGVSSMIIATPIAAYFIFEYLFSAISKTLFFYGDGFDGFLGVFTHGILSLLKDKESIHLYISIMLFSLIVTSILFLHLSYSKRIGRNLLVASYIPLFGSVLGITIVTLAFPVLIMIAGKLSVPRSKAAL